MGLEDANLTHRGACAKIARQGAVVRGGRRAPDSVTKREAFRAVTGFFGGSRKRLVGLVRTDSADGRACTPAIDETS